MLLTVVGVDLYMEELDNTKHMRSHKTHGTSLPCADDSDGDGRSSHGIAMLLTDLNARESSHGN